MDFFFLRNQEEPGAPTANLLKQGSKTNKNEKQQAEEGEIQGTEKERKKSM